MQTIYSALLRFSSFFLSPVLVTFFPLVFFFSSLACGEFSLLQDTFLGLFQLSLQEKKKKKFKNQKTEHFKE